MGNITQTEAERKADRAFRIQLNEYQAQQDRYETESEEIRKIADDLMRPGGECHPWTINNFYEAIEQLPDGPRVLFFSAAAAACFDMNLEDAAVNQKALAALNYAINNYWLRIALRMAESIHYRSFDNPPEEN